MASVRAAACTNAAGGAADKENPGEAGRLIEALACQATLLLDGGRRRVVLRGASVRVAHDEERGPALEVSSRTPKPRRELVTLRGVPVAVIKNFVRAGKATVTAGPISVMLAQADPLDLRDWLAALHLFLTGKLKMGARKSPTMPGSGGKVKRRRPFSPLERQTRPRTDDAGANDASFGGFGGASDVRDPGTHGVTGGAVRLNFEQAEALRYVRGGRSILLTGSAGTGKTRTLNEIIRSLPRATTFVTATTGLAASHVGGMTVHAFAGVGVSDSTSVAGFVAAARRPAAAARWRSCTHLVVDEISMLSADHFDWLEAAARVARGSDAPFGGIQLVLSGDFYQLPPVEKYDKHRKPPPHSRRFAFEAERWDACRLAPMELRQVFRQEDVEFSAMLDRVREGRVGSELLQELRAKSGADLDEDDGILPTSLFTHRADVAAINARQLEELRSQANTYIARDVGSFSGSSCPARDKLQLKLGAQVMLVRTIDTRRGLVNGARGVVTKLGGATGLPTVRFACGVEEVVQRERWTVVSQGRTIGSREQLPLELAWALSVHKSQGMTLDRVEVSLANCFECGQAYVALSRARSLAGLRIIGALPASSVRTHPKVAAFYRDMRVQIAQATAKA